MLTAHCLKALEMGTLEQHANTGDKCPKYIKVKKVSKTICIIKMSLVYV